MQPDKWLRRFHAAAEGAPRLVCFPHGGGAASYYLPLSRELSPGVDVTAAQYPGRQDRLNEPGIADLHVLADRLFEVVAPLAGRPLALFGHSMGALVAFEVANRLQAVGTPARALFASGRRAPSCYRDHGDVDFTDEVLRRELRLLGGTTAELIDDEEFLSMVLPAMRADYQAVVTYRHRDVPKLVTPITVLTGDEDARVTYEEADAWAAHTEGGFDRRVFDGGHFYLRSHMGTISDLIRERLSGARSSGPSAGLDVAPGA